MAERFLSSLEAPAEGDHGECADASSQRLHYLSMILKMSADLFRTVEHHSPRSRYQQRPDPEHAFEAHAHGSTATSVRGDLRPMLSTSGCALEVLMLLLYSTVQILFALIGTLLSLILGPKAHAHPHAAAVHDRDSVNVTAARMLAIAEIETSTSASTHALAHDHATSTRYRS
jgi:hypothetical protein